VKVDGELTLRLVGEENAELADDARAACEGNKAVPVEPGPSTLERDAARAATADKRRKADEAEAAAASSSTPPAPKAGGRA